MSIVKTRPHPEMRRVGASSAMWFADAASLAGYMDDAPDMQADADAERIIGALLQLAPLLYAARAETGEGQRGAQRSLRGLRIGILGASMTHCALAERLRGTFGVAISCWCANAHEHASASASGYHIAADMPTLLDSADILVAIDPAGPGMLLRLDNKALNKVPPHAIVVWDLACGGLDQMALAHALWFETIAGAVLLNTPTARLIPELRRAHNAVTI